MLNPYEWWIRNNILVIRQFRFRFVCCLRNQTLSSKPESVYSLSKEKIHICQKGIDLLYCRKNLHYDSSLRTF